MCNTYGPIYITLQWDYVCWNVAETLEERCRNVGEIMTKADQNTHITGVYATTVIVTEWLFASMHYDKGLWAITDSRRHRNRKTF